MNDRLTFDFRAISVDRDSQTVPVYRQIAHSVALAIRSGELPTNSRLPSQRELARALGVNLTTIGRAYAALNRQGLISGRQGSGTVVRESAPERPPITSAHIPRDPKFIDLSISASPTTLYRQYLAETLASLAQDPRFHATEDYQPAAGATWARAIGARWINRYGLESQPEQVVVSPGAQAALFASLAAICRPNDVVLSSSLAYFGLKGAAAMLGLRLAAISSDEQGPLPDSIDRACRDGAVRAMFLVPCLDNPTTITIPEARRREIVAVLRRHQVHLIEDDIYRPLLRSRPATFAALYPERTVYLNGITKALAPGLRIGFILPPEHLVDRIAENIRTMLWMTSPTLVLVAAIWIENGIVDLILDANRAELIARQTLTADMLSDLRFLGDPVSTHVWLFLPEPWRATEFAHQLQNRGVRVMPSESFAVGAGEIPHAVRINVGAARSQAELQAGLRAVVDTARRIPNMLSSRDAP